MAVEVNTWAGLQNSNNQGETVKWTGGDLDFNDIKPEGFTGAIKLYGSIDFQGATFRNFRHNGGYIYPDGCLNFLYTGNTYVKNLNFVNAIFNVDSSSISRGVIVFGSSSLYTGTVSNCRFDIDATISSSTSATLFSVVRTTSYTGRTEFQQCAFKVKAKNTTVNPINLFNINHADDCRFDIDIDTLYIYREFESDSNGGMHNCEITGKVKIHSGTYYAKFGSASSNYNVYRVKDTGEQGVNTIVSNAGVSVYDNELMTLYNSTNAVGCTEAQLKSASYLNSIGFQIAT